MNDKTVLLAEDNAFVREDLVEALCHRGYLVVQTSDGQEALDVLKAGKVHVDLVVTDLEMPRVNGVVLIQTLALDLDLSKVPIILCSGHMEVAQIGARLGVRTHNKADRLAVFMDLVTEVVGPGRA